MPANNPYYDDEKEDRENGRAPNPTSYVNFQRFFGANKGVAQREAEKYGIQASGAAESAQDALKTSQDQFGQAVKAGSVQAAPVKATTNTGSGANNTTSDAPTTNTGSGSAPPPSSSSSGALTGESTRPGAGGAPAGMTAAQMQAIADQQYTGPGGLGDTAGYQNAQDRATAAQDELDALGSNAGLQALVQQTNNQSTLGTSGFSSGLIGEAGRGQFDRLRAQFNPEKDFAASQEAAGKTAAQAALDSGTNAEDWAAMAGTQRDTEAKEAADAQAQAEAKAAREAAEKQTVAVQVPTKSYEQSFDKDTPENRQAFMMSGVDPKDAGAVAQRQKEIDAYKKAMQLTDQNQVDRAFDDINSVMNPQSWFTDAAGIQDPIHNAGVKNYGSTNQASQTGSTTGIPIAWDRTGVNGFFVFTHMTPTDWETLNNKPVNGPNGQVAWINTRAAQLRELQGVHDSAPRGAGRSQS